MSFAEPLKKKKRIDPAIEQLRTKRKARRIEKEIRRFGRQQRPLKPVEEIEGDRQLYKQLDERLRILPDLSEEELDRRAVLLKDWSRYQTKQSLQEKQQFRRSLNAQRRALDWLYATDIELYKAAIQPSESIPDDPLFSFPYTITGPYFTAPSMLSDQIDGSGDYDPPDGELQDTSPKFQYEFDIDRQFLAEPKKKK